MNNFNYFKELEKKSKTFLEPSLSYIMRIDGVKFSKWTKNLYDIQHGHSNKMVKALNNTGLFLKEKTHADIIYTQSDEISLIFLAKKETNSNNWRQIDYGGNIQKLCSIYCSYATAEFNSWFSNIGLPSAFFDARVFSVSSKENEKK